MTFNSPHISIFSFICLAGRIYIDFSWTGLFSEPVVVNVEDLLVLVSPVADRPYDEEKARNAENASKQQKLSAIEVAKKAASSSDTSKTLIF